MKIQLRLIIALLAMTAVMILALPAAFAESSAAIQYTLDQQGTSIAAVVSDVPFTVNIEMSVRSDNENNNVRDLLLHTAGREFDTPPVFESSARGDWLPNAGNPDQNRLLSLPSGNVWQYMFTAGHGTVDTDKNQYRLLHSLKVRATDAGRITLAPLAPGVSNDVGGNIEPFSVGVVDAGLQIDPQLSVCGDGVVGYFDADGDGIKQDTEAAEACDEGSSNSNAGGCAADCRYVELGWSCSRANFGDRGSSCLKMPPQQFLTEKITALVNGRCYPDCGHPAAMYKDPMTGTAKVLYGRDGKMLLADKYYILGEMGRALREFFTEVIVSS